MLFLNIKRYLCIRVNYAGHDIDTDLVGTSYVSDKIPSSVSSVCKDSNRYIMTNSKFLT